MNRALLTALWVVLLAGCAMSPPGRSWVSASVPPQYADGLALRITRLVANQVPAATSTLVLEKPAYGGKAVAVRVDDRLRWAGFGVIDAPSAHPGGSAVPKHGALVQYDIQPIGREFMVSVRIGSMTVSQLVSLAGGKVISASAVSRRGYE